MTSLSCPQVGCQVSVSGRCLEGFDPPETCPHQREHGPAVDTLSELGQELISLPSGEALSVEQASTVTASGPTNLVIVAGPFGSGKTTLLTALFEAFQEAPFANYSFGGSQTLVGFERRCHLGRRESGREVADTSHTSAREGVVFLHLNLAFRLMSRSAVENLLVSDISGELFKGLRDRSDSIVRAAAIARADHFCIVLDGAKIVNLEARQAARNDSRSILRGIIEAGVLAESCQIQIAITKWDVVVEAFQETGGEDLQRYLDDTISAIRGVAAGRKVAVFEVAARPPVKARVPFAHGLPSLLRSWMRQDRQVVRKPVLTYLSKPYREIDRYTQAVLARTGLRDGYEITQL